MIGSALDLRVRTKSAALGGDPGIRKARPTWERGMKGGAAAKRNKEKVWGLGWAEKEDRKTVPAPRADGLLKTFPLTKEI